MIGRWLLIGALALCFCRVESAAQAAGQPHAAQLDGRICTPRKVVDGQRAEEAKARAATAEVEAQHSIAMQALEAAPGDAPQVLEAQHAYHRARLQALYPLAMRGNARAVFDIASAYRWTESGLTDEIEWRRLVECAARMGDGPANVELFRVYWHDKGDGSFAAIQKNRAHALDLAARAAGVGDFGGIISVATYIGAGRHQYPIDPPLGRRLLELCARAASHACKERLVEEPRFGLTEPAARLAVLEELAAVQPRLYAEERDRLRAQLSQAVVVARRAQRRAGTLAWLQLAADWARLRAEILAKGCPASVACDFGEVCRCTP